MRIAMIDPSLFTLAYDKGLATALARAGHEVTLVSRQPGPYDSDPAGVDIVEAFYQIAGSKPLGRLPGPVRRGIKGLDHLWSMARLARRLRQDAPDVIHFQWLPLPLVDRRMLALFRRTAPLVLTVHDTVPKSDLPSRLQSLGFFDCLPVFDRLIVHTEQGHARLVAQGVPAARLAILPHGIMAAPPGAAAEDPMTGELTFMLFGYIKHYKGADILIEAFARLPETLRAQARVRIVGKPYMNLASLQARIRAHGLAPRVSIEPRFVADDEIPELFCPGTVAVFPYREIDTSGVLVQALEQGRPVVATRIGVFAETLTDGVQGRLCPPDDPPALTACLAQFIEARDFAAGCARAARAFSEQALDWDAVAAQTAALYEAAIGS